MALPALLVLSMAGHLCCGVIPAWSVELMYQILELGLSAAVIWHGLRLGWGSLVNGGGRGIRGVPGGAVARVVVGLDAQVFVLPLTERELELPFLIGDSTVLALDVRWEARSSDPHTERFPDWLEATKLAELGFDCRVPLTSPAARRHYNSQSARPLFVVLELAQESLSRPGRSVGQGTRLIAVDGGLDAQELRREYSDETRYVITRTVAGVSFERHERDGRVLPEPRLRGWLGPLLPNTIFVPKPWCGLLQRLRRSDNTPEGAPEGGSRFVAKVSWGANLEPWVRDVRLLPGSGSR